VISLPDKAFIDTTVFVNALLKQTAEGDAARAALSQYTATELPVYAIKELKAGALRRYVWFHNKVVNTEEWADAVDAIRRVGATPQRYLLSTALQALTDFESSMSKRLVATLAARYPGETESAMKRAEALIWLKTTIMRAWRRRRKITTHVVSELSCYRETDLNFKANGIVDDKPVKCGVQDCCLRAAFASKKDEIASLLKALDGLPDRSENMKRRAAIRHLARTPNRALPEELCRALGDAVFVLQCPADAELLTTNVRDHKPLADAIGKTVTSPTP
jgi:predicted nucleic acid-binding protein